MSGRHPRAVVTRQGPLAGAPLPSSCYLSTSATMSAPSATPPESRAA